MSQETPSKKPTSLPLADAILAIGQGDFSHRVLISFSDLNREKIEQVRRVWALIEPGYRVRFLRGLSDLSEESVLYDFNRIFRLGLDDSDFVVRQGAVAGLWEDESSDLIGKYTSLLDDESQDVQAEAAKALGRFAVLAAAGELDDDLSDQLFYTLLGVATDETQPYLVRRRALEAVAGFGNRGNVYTLIREAIDDDDHGMRAGALFAMGRTLDARWLDIITSEFESDDPEMRYEAARAAGEIGDANAVGGLAALSADPDAEVRFGAVSALGKIGSPASLRVLRRLAERASGEERDAIEEAMRITEAETSDEFPME
jgi:HEAT repeat protein